MVALNAIVNAKYNKCLLVVVGNVFCFVFVCFFSFLLASALCWSYVWFRLFLFAPCSLVSSVSICTTFGTGFQLGFLSCNYTRYMWVDFVPSWNLCSNAVQWCYHLGTGISSTPPFLGESSPGNSILEKKICVRDDSRSKVPLLLSQMLPVDH